MTPDRRRALLQPVHDYPCLLCGEPVEWSGRGKAPNYHAACREECPRPRGGRKRTVVGPCLALSSCGTNTGYKAKGCRGDACYLARTPLESVAVREQLVVEAHDDLIDDLLRVLAG